MAQVKERGGVGKTFAFQKKLKKMLLPWRVNLADQNKHQLQEISCGHTTDFYLGKTDLPRANVSKISRGKFISGFVLPR